MDEPKQYPRGVKQVYRGWIENRDRTDDIVVYLSDVEDEPFAERIQDALEQWGRFVTVRYFVTDTEMAAEEMADHLAKQIVGAADADYGVHWSDLTGYLWTDEEINVGGHDLLEELREYAGRLAHIEIEYFVESPDGTDA